MADICLCVHIYVCVCLCVFLLVRKTLIFFYSVNTIPHIALYNDQ